MRTQHHPFINILVMALCGAICGAEGWKGLAVFSSAKAEWFATFLDMPKGTPSADTFRRVFSALDPAQFHECFRSWVGELAGHLRGEVVAVDGKTVRGALASASAKHALHLLHAWATGQHLLLGQLAVEGAAAEISGLVELVKFLDLEGAVVTGDANFCTAKVTTAIIEKKADYTLCVKGNRGPLHAFVKELFDNPEHKRQATSALTGEVGHGRTEVREAWTIEPAEWPESFRHWRHLRTAVMVERERELNGRVSLERHYYVTSLSADADRLLSIVRSHWGVENGLHWVLDVGFNEDRRRIRNQNAAQNYALLTRIAFMMLKRDKLRAGIALKRQNAGWDPAYLLRLLTSGSVEI